MKLQVLLNRKALLTSVLEQSERTLASPRDL